MRPHRRQPTRLPRPGDSPGKNTGVGCHFLLQCMKVKSESEVAQSCPTLSNPMDCSLPGSSVHRIFQASVLEWGAIAFSSHLYILYYLFPGPNCPMLFIRADPLSFQVEMIEIGLLGSIWHSWGSGSLMMLLFPLWGLSWHWAGPLWEKGKVWLFSDSVVRLFAPLRGWVLSSGLPNSHKGTLIQGWLSKWCFFGKRSVQTYSAILQTSLLCQFLMVCLDFPLLPIQQSMNLLHSHLSSLTLFLLSLIFTSIIFKKL